MLYYTGLNRDASTVLRAQEARTAERINVLRAMRDQVCPIRDIICTGENIIQFGKILHEGWMLKRSITPEISCSAIDAWYNKAIEAGAIGGKLLGAGGGGFLLLFVEPGTQQFVQEAMRDLYRVNFGFDDGGSRITYYDMPVT